MEDQAARVVVQAPEMLRFDPDDPISEVAREINDLIARRAYARGSCPRINSHSGRR